MLRELLSAKNVRVPLTSRTKADLLRELVTLALGDELRDAVADVLRAVESREHETSTAMGGGLGVPHGRTEYVAAMRVAGGLVRGVSDYAGPDGAPVRAVFLLLSPAHDSGGHVRLLARIARLMHTPSSRDALLAAVTVERFLEVVEAAEAARPSVAM